MKKLFFVLIIFLMATSFTTPAKAEQACFCGANQTDIAAEPTACSNTCAAGQERIECDCEASPGAPCDTLCTTIAAHTLTYYYCVGTNVSAAVLTGSNCSCAPGENKVTCDCGESHTTAPCQVACATEPVNRGADECSYNDPNGGGTSPAPDDEFKLPNFLGVEEPSVVIGRIIKYIMGFVGVIALVTFMYGGTLWLISGGREAYVEKGQSTMIWSAVGLAIVFAAYILIDFIFKLFGK